MKCQGKLQRQRHYFVTSWRLKKLFDTICDQKSNTGSDIWLIGVNFHFQVTESDHFHLLKSFWIKNFSTIYGGCVKSEAHHKPKALFPLNQGSRC